MHHFVTKFSGSCLEMKSVGVGTLQLSAEMGNKETNIAKVAELFDAMSKEKVDIVVIPKNFSTGFPSSREELEKWAEPVPGPTCEELADLARKYRMDIVGGTVIEKEGERFFDTCPILGSDGKLVGKYRRVHVSAFESELGFAAGTEHLTFDVHGGPIGVLIASDIDFPEAARILSLKGAPLVFWLAAVGYEWIDICRSLENAQAFINIFYLVVSNLTGKAGGTFFFGESRIINPMGETVACAGTNYGEKYQNNVAIASIDLEMVRRIREQPTSLLNRRRPETYKLLT